MNTKLGRHYLADLYLCQNLLWDTPFQLLAEIAKVIAAGNVNRLNWVFQMNGQSEFLISGELDAAFILIQLFPEQKFLTLDLFSWSPNFNLEQCTEGLIELFAPQVVAAETRLRAEHLN